MQMFIHRVPPHAVGAVLTVAAVCVWAPVVPSQTSFLRAAIRDHRQSTPMAWDPVGQQVLAYGGTASGQPSNETWSWRPLEGWQRLRGGLYPYRQPPSIDSAPLVTVPGRGVVVLALGPDGTWEWDGQGWTQRLLDGGPFPATAAAAFDAVRDEVVVVALGATWTYDGTAWSQRQPATAVPGSGDVELVFDAVRGEVVAWFGYAQQTWIWDGVDWRNAAPTHHPPAGESRRALVFDSSRGVALARVGRQTWQWDGSDWQRVAGGLAIAETVRGHSLCYHPPTGSTLLFGGQTAAGRASSASLAWDGATWQPAAPGPRGVAPGSRFRAALAYDSARERVVLVGGQAAGEVLGDCHAYAGDRWLPVPSLPAGQERRSHAMAYDRVRDQLVLFGGLRLDSSPLVPTLIFDGTQWHARPGLAAPPSRERAAMAYDPVADRVLLFGGQGASGPLNDTWSWDGSTWTQIPTGTDTPPPDGFPSMAWDGRRGHLALLSNGLLHRFTGSGWVVRPMANTALGALAYDEARGKLVVIQPDGRPAQESEGPVRQWTVVAGDRSECSPDAVAYDARRGVVVQFGGYPTNPVLDASDATWELTPQRPARVEVVGSACAGTQGEPRITVEPASGAWVGRSFALQVEPLPTALRGILVLVGASSTQWPGGPLPFDLGPIGMTGCTLYGSADAVVTGSAGNGVGRAVFTVPFADIIGDQPVFQVLVWDAGANPFGAVTTAALRLTIGSL